MRLFQNLLITDNPGFFKKLSSGSLLTTYIRIVLSLAQQLMSPQKMFSILIFGSPVCTPLIPCHHYWTGDDLDCNNIQKHGEQTVLQNYLRDEDRGVREETIFSIFRWNIVLQDSYQADEIVTEIEEWKQKVPDVCVKSFGRVLLSVLETSVVS